MITHNKHCIQAFCEEILVTADTKPVLFVGLKKSFVSRVMMEVFSTKNLFTFFLFLHENICYGYL